MADRPKVLIVDDDEFARQLVRDLVRRCGFEPVSVKSTHDAIGILAVLQPLAVLLDLHLPEDPGDECCRVIKGNTDLAYIPVVFMTGSAAEADVQRAFFAGGDDFLQKPLREHQLRSKLEAIEASFRQQSAPPSSLEAATVLIADDDPFFRAVLGRRLEKAGYWTMYASSGLEALDSLQQAKPGPALCIVDLVMPGLGGIELIQRLRETPVLAQLPIVVVTGVERTPTALATLRQLGVDAVIDKNTMSVEHVLAQIRAKLFRGQNQRAERRVRLFRPSEFRSRQGGDWLSGFTYDLSETGVAIRTLTPARAASTVDVRFSLGPGAGRLGAQATVVWSSPYEPAGRTRQPHGMGLRFAELSAETRAWIQEYAERAKTLQ